MTIACDAERARTKSEGRNPESERGSECNKSGERSDCLQKKKEEAEKEGIEVRALSELEGEVNIGIEGQVEEGR